MANLPSAGSAKPSTSFGGRYAIGVAVDTFEVDTLLNSVMQAVSPAGLRAFGEQVADYLDERTANRFAYEGDDASGNWLPLAPSTERIRASLGYGPDGPINIRTNELFQYVTYTDEISIIPGGVAVTKPDPAKAKGVVLKKLMTAQWGTIDNPMFPGAHTPPRPVVALGQRDMTEIMAKLQLYVMATTTRMFVTKASS